MDGPMASWYKGSGGGVTVISRQPTRGKVILNMMIIPNLTIPDYNTRFNKCDSMMIIPIIKIPNLTIPDNNTRFNKGDT